MIFNRVFADENLALSWQFREVLGITASIDTLYNSASLISLPADAAEADTIPRSLDKHGWFTGFAGLDRWRLPKSRARCRRHGANVAVKFQSVGNDRLLGLADRERVRMLFNLRPLGLGHDME